MVDTEKTPTEQLLDAVEKLAKPYHDREVIVDDDPIHGTDKKVIASLPRDGLLKQLRSAVVGGIGSHEGALPGRERLPFDTGALELYDAIEKDVTRKFVNLVQKPVHLELERTLMQWYLAFIDAHSKGSVADGQLLSAVTVMRGWVLKIEAHFVQPKQLELTVNQYARDTDGNILEAADKSWVVESRLPARCPLCDAEFAVVPETGFRVWALVLEYRELGRDTMKSALGLCRACKAVWEGGSGVRELAYQLEQQETRRNAPEVAV